MQSSLVQLSCSVLKLMHSSNCDYNCQSLTTLCFSYSVRVAPCSGDVLGHRLRQLHLQPSFYGRDDLRLPAGVPHAIVLKPIIPHLFRKKPRQRRRLQHCFT